MRTVNARPVLTAVLATLALFAAACGSTGETAPGTSGSVEANDAADPTAVETPADDEEPADARDGDHSATADEPHVEAADTDHDEAATDTDHDEAAGDVDRTVEVEMSEFAFTPSNLGFEAGETVRFVFTNIGDAPHEAVLGDHHVQEEHEAAMAEGMGDHGGSGHHGDIPSVTVESGETGEFVHTFTESGELMLGCHLPGHWGQGMRATLQVAQ